MAPAPPSPPATPGSASRPPAAPAPAAAPRGTGSAAPSPPAARVVEAPPHAPAGGGGGPMRRMLDGLYDGAAGLAALSMVGLLAMVLLSIVSRQLHFHVPGTDAYAGYLMAAAGFLALAHTLKRGEHIRVTLLLHALGGRARHALEVWALAAAVLLAALFAYYSIKLSWQSWQFHDVSTASDATPLWLPQLAMAVGTCILLVAFVDELVLELRGRRPHAREGAEPPSHE